MDFSENYVVNTITEWMEHLDTRFEGVPKWQIVFGTVTLTTGVIIVQDLVKNRADYIASIRTKLVEKVKNIPAIKEKIEKELIKTRQDIIQNCFYEPGEKDLVSFVELPEEGKSKEEILEFTKEIFQLGKYNWSNGKVSGGVQTGQNNDYTIMMKEVYRLCSWANPLHADIFPGVRKMEAEIVKMTSNIFNATDEAVGCLTTGGSESLLLMVKSYRDWGREERSISQPEMVAAITIHAGVDKGAEVLGVKLRKVPIDEDTGKINLAAARKAINRNTVLVIGSAPEYAHGIVDDIEALGKLALKKGIGLHVDCCLGGYILPFMERAGYPLDPFDFRVPGVTSISADPHKYGNCPKGTSVLMYSELKYLHYQYFSVPNWPGGIYATPTVCGSRAGANTGVCWAALTYYGRDGYVSVTRNIISIARTIKHEIRKIPGLFVYGDPLASVVSFGSKEFNVYKVADLMSEKGWHLQPLQHPHGIHIFLTSLHTREGIVEELIRDLKLCVDAVKNDSSEPEGGLAKLYGIAHSLPDKSLVEDAAKVYLDVYFSPVKK